MDAWLDLAGEQQRARLAADLARALESSAVMLAGALAAQPLQSGPPEVDQFVKSTDAVHLSVRSLLAQAQANRSLELRLPSPSSLLASKWMNLDDSYTLHLQTGPADAPTGSDLSQQPVESQGHSGKFFTKLAGLMDDVISKTSRRLNLVSIGNNRALDFYWIYLTRARRRRRPTEPL